jgi:hypothetical protein
MKTRDNSVVIKGLQRDHSLLAAYLEATNRIDWQPRHKHHAGTPEPVNVEAQTASTEPQLPKVVPPKSFVFGRANLVRASGRTQLAAGGVKPISLEHEVQYPNRSKPDPFTRILTAGYFRPILKGARRVLVTWLPLATGVGGHKREALSPQHREFDDLTNAISFVMGLETSLQATATIGLPRDDAIGLASIKQMYAAQEKPNLP